MTAQNFFTQSMTLYAHSGTQDRYGDKEFSSGVSVKGKFVVKSDLFVDSNGQEYQYDAIAYLPLSRALSMQDRITYDGIDYSIMHITEQRGTVTTLKHKKILLQRLKVNV